MSVTHFTFHDFISLIIMEEGKKNYKVPLHIMSYVLLLPPLRYLQIFPRAASSQTPLVLC